MASSPDSSLTTSSSGKRTGPLFTSYRSGEMIRGSGERAVSREIIDLTIDDLESDEQEGSRVQQSAVKRSKNVTSGFSIGSLEEESFHTADGSTTPTGPANTTCGSILQHKEASGPCISMILNRPSRESKAEGSHSSIDSSSNSEVDIFAGTSLRSKDQPGKSRTQRKVLSGEASTSDQITDTAMINKAIHYSANKGPGDFLTNGHEYASYSSIDSQVPQQEVSLKVYGFPASISKPESKFYIGEATKLKSVSSEKAVSPETSEDEADTAGSTLHHESQTSSSFATLVGKISTLPKSTNLDHTPTSPPNLSTTAKQVEPHVPGALEKEKEFSRIRKILRQRSKNWREERQRTGTLQYTFVPKPPLVPCKRSAKAEILEDERRAKRNKGDIWNDFTYCPVDRLSTSQIPTLGELNNGQDDTETAHLKADSVNVVGAEEGKSLSLSEALDMDKSKELIDGFENAVNAVLGGEGKDAKPELTEETFTIPVEVLKRLERSNRMRNGPNFLTPHDDILYIEVGGQTFAIYEDFILHHVPRLYQSCSAAITHDMAVAPEILQDFEIKVVALLIQWMYSSPADAYSGLSGENDETTHQDCLIQLWVLGKRLEVDGLQIDALDALDRRIKLDQSLDLGSSRWLWDNTSNDDKLREYFIQSCVEDYSNLESKINEFAPAALRETIERKVGWLRDWMGI
ncbi:hypothetical protein DSL72_009482 [Monilinia vaccinii-corymbosi]|uniref:BTB domain-containing protein n=1 Tax=Monilinia vaccinii-corymbosi TaxID=61207 RepID=A0A8A3PR72_9HELO|nr:hypothetical protein DSL72_009482 [Monilinia vaccinii-corymbosi]